MSSITAYSDVHDLSQEAIVERYASLVKRIGHHMLGRLPRSVQLDDLIQAGMIGLLGAAKNYDVTKGAKFETYARIRIRGMMLDEVRRNDWVPRSVYRNSRLVSHAIRELENEYGRDVRDVEVAEAIGISLDEYHKILRDVNTTQVYGFDDIGLNDDLMNKGYNSSSYEPLDALQKEKFRKSLGAAIETLPDREKLVLALYYDEEMNLKEIGEILEVSESRVCQIHSQALLRLQARVRAWKQ